MYLCLNKLTGKHGKRFVLICQFVNFGRGIHVTLSQKYEERVQKRIQSTFLHNIILKQNYIVIFIPLSLVNICQNLLDCINAFLDSQCVVS